MHEVIQISHGPQANWLTADFFNTQETYFVWRKEDLSGSLVDPNVRFVGGLEFTPRLEVWDFRQGYGYLPRQSEKYEAKAADVGRTEKLVQQTVSPGRYWTDDLRVPLHPSSRHEIETWEFDPVRFPRGRLRGATEESGSAEFTSFSMGSDQFRQLGGEDYVEETLRRSIEQCDLLSGVVLTTQNGGWSGFSAAMTESLRDDYIPHTPLAAWVSTPSFQNSRVATNTFLDTMLKLSEMCSVVIPLSEAATNFEDVAAAQLPLFETVSLLSSLRRNRVSMHQLCADLKAGQTDTNIVSSRRHKVFAGRKKVDVKTCVQIARGRDIHEDDTLFTHEATTKYLCPQPRGNSEKELYELVLDSSPLGMRSLVAPRDHARRADIGELTEPYIWTYQSDSDSDNY